jgi:hypothetical protein
MSSLHRCVERSKRQGRASPVETETGVFTSTVAAAARKGCSNALRTGREARDADLRRLVDPAVLLDLAEDFLSPRLVYVWQHL